MGALLPFNPSAANCVGLTGSNGIYTEVASGDFRRHSSILFLTAATMYELRIGESDQMIFPKAARKCAVLTAA